MAKLVLEFDLEPSLIEKIRSAAKAKKESLTEYAEELFKKAAEREVSKEEASFKVDDDLSDWVKSLVMADKPTPDFDAKKMYGDYIMEKYGQ